MVSAFIDIIENMLSAVTCTNKTFSSPKASRMQLISWLIQFLLN